MTLSSIRQITTRLQVASPANSASIAPRTAAPHLRVLFQGPAGSGKSEMVEQLSRESNRQVFRIDLSKFASQSIGEVENNLERIISQAEHDSGLLFFDEADSLFGKRTDVKDAHDRYANTEVSYLLQRIERYNGTVVIATRKPPTIKHPLLQRMQVVVRFPIPGVGPRSGR